MKLLNCVLSAGLSTALLSSRLWAGDTTPQALLEHWRGQAAGVIDARRGQVFFSQRHGRDWSCATCHHAPPTRMGEHAATAKPINPLAPSANAQALTSIGRVNKWFKRNCQDVLGRECSAQEKADVLAYLIAVQ